MGSLDEASVMAGFLQRRVVQPIKSLLLQGITPEKIALSLACGAVLAVFPVLGSTTLLCAVAAILLGLNLPAIQLVNYLMYPIQLALIVPFLRAGAFLFHTKPLPFSLSQMLAMFPAATHAIHSLCFGFQRCRPWWSGRSALRSRLPHSMPSSVQRSLASLGLCVRRKDIDPC